MLDRKTAPAYNQSTAFDLIAPDTKKLANGLDLFFVRGGSQEVLKVELLFKAGRWVESFPGAAYFTSHLLSKGTSKRSSFEIAQIFDLYGAHLEVNAGLDLVSVALYSLTKNLKPVLDLLMEILTDPIFSEKELTQTKSIYVQNLKVNMEKTSFLASKLFRKNLFGETHPYGIEIEENDVTAIQQPQLTSHYATFFKESTIFVSGKIDAENENLITKTFSTLHVQKSPGRTVEPVITKPVHLYQEKEKSVQSSIRMGGLSALRRDPDYSAIIFTAHVLGGYFGSRLMKNLREEKGLTYGVYSSIHPLKHASYLVIGADVNKENVELTFDEIRKELKNLRTDKIPLDELQTAKNHFIGSLQSEITTPFAHADKLKTLYLHALPADYYQNMISSVKNFSAEKLIEVSEKYYHEEKFFEIAVG
jgi:zinc protease